MKDLRTHSLSHWSSACLLAAILLTLLIFGIWLHATVHKQALVSVKPPVKVAAKPITTTPRAPTQLSPSATSPSVDPNALTPPIADFKARITKKFFGTYVTPQNSPVQPERFTGYHTGVDVEYGDVTGIVPVYAIADGTVTYANWVSGYGGVIVIEVTIDGAPHLVLYGHVDPTDLPAVGTTVQAGQVLDHLGPRVFPRSLLFFCSVCPLAFH